MPADGGERDLPVVHFYAPQAWSDPIPVGVEVGFAHGQASVWFPAVSSQTPASVANSLDARSQRARLVAQRTDPDRPSGDLGIDPTRQLHWDRLLLSKQAVALSTPTDEAWVLAARAVPDALWVNGPAESERFLFYEAQTQERSAVVIEAGDTAANHYVLQNRSEHDVFDVIFVHDGRQWMAPRIPAGKSAGFLLRDPYAPAEAKAWLTQR